MRKYVVTTNDILPDYRLSTFAALGYFQDSVAAFFSDRHLAAFDVRNEGIVWVISDHSIRFTAEVPLWDDEVTSEVVLSEVTPVRLIFDFRLLGRDGVCFAEGSGTWLPVHAESGRPFSMDTFCEVHADSVDGTPARLHRRAVFPKPGTMVKEQSRLMTFSDMDFNRHVGNRSYVNFALQTLPVDLDLAFDVDEIIVRFMRQTFIGDTLTARVSYPAPDGGIMDTSSYLVSETNSAGEEVCRLLIRTCQRDTPRLEIGKHLIR